MLKSEDQGEMFKFEKKIQNLQPYELIYISNSTETENCTENVNVTSIFPVTRDDNWAIFRCSSQNNFTRERGPSRDSSKITVICMYSNFYILELCLRCIETETCWNKVSDGLIQIAIWVMLGRIRSKSNVKDLILWFSIY